jgi:predicted P-loop ATPase
VSASTETLRQKAAKAAAGKGRGTGRKGRSPTPPTDWRGVLRQKNDGHFVGDELAVLTALRHAPELKGLVRYDEFSRRMELTRAPVWRPEAATGDLWTDDDDVSLQAWLQSVSVDVRARNCVADSVGVVARENHYHPVRDYLKGLKWDGTWRLGLWLKQHLGATGEPAYLEAIGRRFMVSAVARVMRPGCKVDHTLVLEGAQGLRKSTVAETLAVRPDWFVDRMPTDLNSADAAAQLAGHWIVELAELASLRGVSSIETVKAFLTRKEDTYRPPFGRRPVTCARQCVFIGTTNEGQFLRDRTGNRRFWPVHCERADIEALARDRDQLWAEAFMLHSQGEQWHLTGAEELLAADEQSGRVLVTEIEASVADFLAGRMADAQVTVQEVLIGAFKLTPGDPNYATQAARMGTLVANAMEACGWMRLRRAGTGANKRTIYGRKP